VTAPVAQRTLVVELRDRPGVLYRAVGVVRRHGYNIESLLVTPSGRAGVSRATLVVAAADAERLARQLLRLVDVLSATVSPSLRSEPWPSSTTTQMPTYDL
jgi:acetolactate synthase I/III small subunit